MPETARYRIIAAAVAAVVTMIAAVWAVVGVVVPWAREINSNVLKYQFRIDAQKERIDAQDRRIDNQDGRIEAMERHLRGTPSKGGTP